MDGILKFLIRKEQEVNIKIPQTPKARVEEYNITIYYHMNYIIYIYIYISFTRS
jgi:hypothetical protein